jgi:hypothetical protein
MVSNEESVFDLMIKKIYFFSREKSHIQKPDVKFFMNIYEI